MVDDDRGNKVAGVAKIYYNSCPAVNALREAVPDSILHRDMWLHDEF